MARSRIEAARLRGAEAAKLLHDRLDMRRQIEMTNGPIDVFNAIAALEIPLVFKPLSSALGLCLPEPLRGIIITSRRTKNIQRFTAAHELGHVELGHEGSIDHEILQRAPTVEDRFTDYNEVEAEAFASEFLLPRWLFAHHIRRQKWKTGNELRDPKIIYQLSLRLGASFEATCYGMLHHRILPKAVTDHLLSQKVKTIKAAVGEGREPPHPWADRWEVTQRDQNGALSGSQDDLLHFKLSEHASSGLRWDEAAFERLGLQVVADRSHFDREAKSYGGTAIRSIVVQPSRPLTSKLILHERREWAPSERDPFVCRLQLEAKEQGMSTAERRRRGALDE